MPDMETTFGLIALVLGFSALASGLVERGPLSFPMLFLGLGLLLSDDGLGVLTVGPHDPTLEVLATISLALVLFLDAVQLRFDELGRDWRVPMLALGPGTLLTIGLTAGAAALLLDASLVEALLLGAILASTDPVVLRDMLRDRRIPRSVRRALSVEAGTNDIVVLPGVLVLIAAANEEAGGVLSWLGFLAKLLVLSPAAGVLVGGLGAWLMSRADRRYTIRRVYQALYGIGLVLAAYFAGDAVGGDGFLAAFAAGAAVTIFDVELCDCFLEYGEVTAEMAMLFTFILFGAVIAEIGHLVSLVPTLAFAALVIGVSRPLAMGFVLRRATMSREARAFIAWFGPRGLASLLLALLVVKAGVAEGEWLLAVTGVVALVSVVAHGVSATPLTALYARRVARSTLAEEREASATGLFRHADDQAVPRVSVEALHALLQSASPPLVLDVRTRSQYAADGARIPGSIRVLPDEVAEWAAGQSRERSIVAYCT